MKTLLSVCVWLLNFLKSLKFACGVGVGRAIAMSYFEVVDSGLTEMEGKL